MKNYPIVTGFSNALLIIRLMIPLTLPHLGLKACPYAHMCWKDENQFWLSDEITFCCVHATVSVSRSVGRSIGRSRFASCGFLGRVISEYYLHYYSCPPAHVWCCRLYGLVVFLIRQTNGEYWKTSRNGGTSPQLRPQIWHKPATTVCGNHKFKLRQV